MRIERMPLAPGQSGSPGHGGSVELRLVFACTQANVRTALRNTMAGLGAMNLTEDESSTVELVLAEVLNNVTEHAYRDDEKGLIELHLKQTAAGLSCRVMDAGAAMPRNTPPAGYPPDPDRPLDSQPEGGFGWFLIRRLTRDLTYLREPNRNILCFRIEVGQETLRPN